MSRLLFMAAGLVAGFAYGGPASAGSNGPTGTIVVSNDNGDDLGQGLNHARRVGGILKTVAKKALPVAGG